MRRRLLTAAVAIVGAAGVAGCAAGGSATPVPTPTPGPSAWERALDSVQSLVGAGRYATADSLLQRHVTTGADPEVRSEAAYWRALLALDPSNPASTPRDALVAIDGYLAGGMQQPRYAEALLLRRTAETLERTAGQLVPIPTITMLPSDSLVRLRVAQDSIRALRAELERTQAELERIRRRIRP